MANINDVMNDGDIYFEPRLQEYLNRKKYYEENNIEPIASLERQYSITKEDMKLINDYIRNKKVYKSTHKDKYLDLVDTAGQKFESNNFKDDPRFKRFKKKMERTKEAIKQRNNYSEWDDGYSKILGEDVDQKQKDKFDFHNNNKINNQINNQKFSTPTIDGRNDPYKNQRLNNDIYDAPIFLDSRDFALDNKYRIPNNNDARTYNNQTKISNQKVMHQQDLQNNSSYLNNKALSNNNDFSKIIGNLNSYANNEEVKYQYSSEMDNETKRIKPSLNSRGKSYHNTSRYQSVPYMGSKTGLKDISIESELRSGDMNPQYKINNDWTRKRDNESNLKNNSFVNSKAKTVGYDNPVEHYFDYISNDIQDPNHVVLPFPRGGIDTRQDNHSVAKPYTRQIM